MKPLYIILSLTILILLNPACKKRENAAPATTDSIKVDTVLSNKIIYPYADTFIGYLQNYEIGDFSFTDTFSSFSFYINHISSDSIEFQNSITKTNVWGELWSSDNIFYAKINNINTYIYSAPNMNIPDAKYSLVKDSLYVSWDYFVGENEFKGTYNGKVK